VKITKCILHTQLNFAASALEKRGKKAMNSLEELFQQAQSTGLRLSLFEYLQPKNKWCARLITSNGKLMFWAERDSIQDTLEELLLKVGENNYTSLEQRNTAVQLPRLVKPGKVTLNDL
jgi:hypothetical protein